MTINLKSIKEKKQNTVKKHFETLFPNSELDLNAQKHHQNKNYTKNRVPHIQQTKKYNTESNKKTKKNIILPND